MAPTGYESTAYTAVPYQQPNNQAQLGGGIAIFAEPTYHTGYVPSKLASQQQQPTEQIYKLSNVSVGQENPVLYQPLLVTQPPQSSSQPQYQQQCHLSADQDPTAGYAIPGISPRTTVSAVPSSVNWANSPTVTTTSTTEASVGHEWSAFSKDELTRRNPQELSS
ncbi:hypothetical protein FBU30_002691 [Linnemannia zychae]|nr:hypothetical protein FBU30_002691 [Linnemannia zychae]